MELIFGKYDNVPEVCQSDAPLERHESPHAGDHVAVAVGLHGLPVDDGGDGVGHRRHPRHQGADQRHVSKDEKTRWRKSLGKRGAFEAKMLVEDDSCWQGGEECPQASSGVAIH